MLTKESTQKEMKLSKQLNILMKHLDLMAEIYSEKRSDVTDMLDRIMEGFKPNTDMAEKRFVRWSFEGNDFEYDTLTTLVSYKGTKHYETITNIEYTD